MILFQLLHVFLWYHEGRRAYVGLSACGRVIYKGEEAKHSTPLHGYWETDRSNTLVIAFKYKSGSTQDEWIEHRFRVETADGLTGDTVIYRDIMGTRVLVMVPDEEAHGFFSRKDWWDPEEDTDVIHLIIKGPEMKDYPAAEPTAMSMYKDKPITTWDVVKFFNRNNTAFCLKQEASYCLTIQGPTGHAFEAREGEVLQDVIAKNEVRGGSVPFVNEVQEFDVIIKVGKRILEHAGYRAENKRRLKQLSIDQRLEILQKVHQRENAAESGTRSSQCQLVLRLPVWNPNP